MGTPEFSVPTLDILNKYHNIIGVYTQPPRPSGRGMQKIKSPIQIYSEKNKLNFHTPNNIKNNESFNLLNKLKPDLIIVVAYGLIIPEIILNIPSLAWSVVGRIGKFLAIFILLPPNSPEIILIRILLIKY